MTAEILKTYLRRLTNLSTRNRSLLLTSLPSEQFLDWKSLDFVENRSAFDLLKEVIAQKKNTKLCAKLDSRSEKVNDISKRLRKIANTERFIEEERGSEDLYVAYPFVRGKLMDGTVIHAPLAFFPVTLGNDTTDNAHWYLQRRAEAASLNRNFLLAYSHFNQVKIAEELLEFNLDELSRDMLVFRTELYELLKNSVVEINFNQDLFQNQLQYFEGITKADLDLLERTGELRLYPEAVLGIFPQAGSYLGPDYEQLILQNDFVIENNPQYHVSAHTKPKEATTFTVFEQDASQEEALRRIKMGESLVVQGPPGTGKSQLIANLMSDFSARGKRVLLVCQKRVALDVVYERLHQVGMDPFVALVHDFKNDRAELYRQLDAQIEHVEAHQKLNYALDAIVMDRRFLQVSRSIEQIMSELQGFKTALFGTTDCGLSPKELYLTSKPSQAFMPLPQFRDFCFDEKLSHFITRLNRYEQYAIYLSSTHPWHERVSFATITFQELQTIHTTINEVKEELTLIEQKTKKWLGRSFALEDVLKINTEKIIIDQWLQVFDDEQVWVFFKKIKTGFITKDNDQRLKEIKKLSAQRMLGEEVTSSELLAFATRLSELLKARTSALKWLFYGDKKYIKTIADKYSLSLEINDLYQLQAYLQHRQGWETAIRPIEEDWRIELLSERYSVSKSNLDDFMEAISKAQIALNAPHVAFLSVLIERSHDFSSFQKSVYELLDFCNQTQQNYQLWRRYLAPSQINAVHQNSSFATHLQTSLQQDFDLLTEADKLKEGFSRDEFEIISGLLTEKWPKNTTWATVFQNSLRLAWVAYLEEKYPILRAVSSLKMNQLEEELQEAILEKQRLNREILLMQLREQTYKEVAFNRLQNRTTYRELQHQVTKKRKIWPVRKLMEHHAEEVFRLIPCWLASPETISAVFPLMPGFFDLVIFDEASQCYAEYGIPAIYRGRQTVVVGDSKQLTPFDLYRIKYEADTEEETPALEVASLLDLAKQYWPEVQLQGHYRSQSLALIDFSNQHFYKNKLQLLPYFKVANSLEPAIYYEKVEGVWENNQNEVEADKIVELVQQLQQNFPMASLGIVTFNQPQQQLIAQKIALIEEQGTQIASALFVKNIENVQGDERDIILFSVGYAPDIRGKMKAQFGSLNVQGGENRLNVAITRARQRIVVVTSILPHQLQVENTAHVGPKLLKAYLYYALEVSEGIFKPQPLILEKKYSDWFLKEQLKQKKTTQELKEELPFADLTIKENNRYTGVILTDDEHYQQAISVKEAHAYLPLQLRNKGWFFERVWSREWWRKQ